MTSAEHGGAAPTAPAPSVTPRESTNPLAAAALVSTFVLPLAGIVLGHLAIGQIRRDGGSGRGLALAALILGYGTFALLALVVLALVLFLLLAAMTPFALPGIHPAAVP